MNKRRLLTWPLLLLLLVSLVACNPSKRAQSGNLKPRSEKFLLDQLLDQQVKADWFSAKAKILYSDDYETVRLTANIRLRKDSVIWMNFKKLSVEAARILITPDSIFVMDRINKQYTIQTFDELSKRTGLPNGFQSLQAAILGNPVFLSTKMTASSDSLNYQLTGESQNFRNEFHLSGVDYALRKVIYEEKSSRRRATLELSDRQPLENQEKFSYLRTVSFDSEQNGFTFVEAEFSNVEIDIPKEIRFEIPSRYTYFE